MRILMVTNTYLPVRNGVTMSVAGWTAGLRVGGHHVDVWTISSASQDSLPTGTYRTPGIDSFISGFPAPTRPGAPPEVRVGRYDVVHAHHPVVLGVRAARLAKATGAAFVATAHSDYLAYVHSYGGPRLLHGWMRDAGRSAMRRFFNGCDTVFAPSRRIEHELGEWGVTAPICPVVYPVDERKLGMVSRTEARARLGVEQDRPLALYVGRMAEDKRVTLLLDEFARTRAAVPDAVLALAGDGPLAGELRVRAVAEGLGEHVRFLGTLAEEPLGLWYSAADAVVSASPNEVGPVTAIEAAVCGSPVVAYRVPGFDERVDPGRTGLLAEEGEPGALGMQLASLLEDRELAARMGRQARVEAGASHTLAAAAETLAGVYAELVSANSGAQG